MSRRRGQSASDVARCLSAVAVAALFAVVLGSNQVAAARPSKLATFNLRVSFKRQLCGTAVTQPLISAPVVLTRDGRIVAHTTLSARGTAKVHLARKPAVAWAELENAHFRFKHHRIGLAPPGAKHDVAYIELGEVHPGANALAAHDVGAANAWSQLQLNYAYASAITVKPLKPIVVELEATSDTSEYVAATHTLFLTSGGELANSGAIAHEFGHYVMYSNIDEFPGQGGTHNVPNSYPARPGIAFYEGWAWAYAAGEQGTPDWTLADTTAGDCQNAIDLSAQTPTVPLVTPFWAQYNEEAGAYVIYQLAGYLGGGDVKPGLAAIVHAYTDNEIDGQPVYTMRGLRDALIADGTEQQSNETHHDINSIFAQFGMSWGLGIVINQDPAPEKGSLAQNRVTIGIDGPDGFQCQSSDPTDTPLAGGGDWEGTVLAGPLAYTWTDDCVLDGQSPLGAYDHEDGGASYAAASAYVLFPYEQNGSEIDGTYTIWAEFTCGATDTGDDNPDGTHECEDWTGGNLILQWMGFEPPPLSNPGDAAIPTPTADSPDSDPLDGAPVVHGLDLARDTKIPLVTFKGDGSTCEIVVSGQPCYQGPSPITP